MPIDLRFPNGHSRQRVGCWLILTGLWVTAAFAGGGPTTAESTTRPTTQPEAIQPGDWLQLRIDDLLGAGVPFVQYVRVSSDGKLSVPVIGTVAVKGQTTTEAASKVSDAFVVGLRATPHVSIEVIYRRQIGEPLPRPIAVGDLVRSEIDLKGDGSRTVLIHRVAQDGTLTFPDTGKIEVVDLNDCEAAKAISGAYTQKKIIDNPTANVITLEHAPADAGKRQLPDGPVNAVPEPLKPLFK